KHEIRKKTNRARSRANGLWQRRKNRVPFSTRRTAGRTVQREFSQKNSVGTGKGFAAGGVGRRSSVFSGQHLSAEPEKTDSFLCSHGMDFYQRIESDFLVRFDLQRARF